MEMHHLLDAWMRSLGIVTRGLGLVTSDPGLVTRGLVTRDLIDFLECLTGLNPR